MSKTGVMFIAAGVALVVGVGITVGLATGKFASHVGIGCPVSSPQCAHWAALRCFQLLGVPIGMDQLQREMPYNPKGHNLLQIETTLTRHGLKTQGRRETWETLSENHLPCVAHLREPDHFVVVSHVDAKKGFIHIFDGQGRRTRWSREAFERRWSGIVLSVDRDSSNRSAVEASIRFDYLLLDRGNVPAVGAPTEFAFPFHNKGNSELVIKKVHVRCACLKTEKPEKPIPPHGSGVIKLFYKVEPSKGVFSHTAVVETSDPRVPTVILSATGFTGVEIEIIPNRLTFERLIVDREYTDHFFVKYSGEWEDFDVQIDDSNLKGAVITKYSCRKIDEELVKKLAVGQFGRVAVPSQTGFLEFVLQPTGRMEDAVDGTIAIRTNVSGYETIIVPITGSIQAPVKAYPSIIIFEENKPRCDVTLASLTGEPFRVDSVDTRSNNLTCCFDEATTQGFTKLEFRVQQPSELRAVNKPIFVKLDLPQSGRRVALPLRVVAWPPRESRDH